MHFLITYLLALFVVSWAFVLSLLFKNISDLKQQQNSVTKFNLSVK